jgi:hypothetical protein
LRRESASASRRNRRRPLLCKQVAFGQHLEGDIAIEVLVTGSIDFSMPPAPMCSTIW